MSSLPTLVSLLLSVIVTGFLFYLDKDLYDEGVLAIWWNAFWFLVYVAGIWAIQILLMRYLFNKKSDWTKIILSTLVGLPLGVVIMLALMMALAKVIA